MGHQMWEVLFVTTFQNKDNLLIYTKTICKSSYKMQKNIISLFCTIIFLQTRKNSHTTQLFYLSIYLFVLQLTSQKVIYSAYRKKSSFYLPSLILSFFFQTRKKKTPKKCKFIYFELGPNIHWTSNYGTGIVFIGNMLSWLSFHNFV